MTLPFVLAPMAFVAGAIYLLGPMLPLTRPWARWTVFACVWLIVLRYLDWRLFDTVLPASGGWLEFIWIWLCFAIEILALMDAFVLYLAFLRTSDRRLEADRHEARVRRTPREQLPNVDVYIPTYNEPLEILEKTVTGALSLDYPNFQIWRSEERRVGKECRL